METLYVIPCSALARNWVGEARRDIGLDFIDPRVRSSVIGNAVRGLTSGEAPVLVKREIYRILFRYWKGRAYSEERNRRNWAKRVATP